MYFRLKCCPRVPVIPWFVLAVLLIDPVTIARGQATGGYPPPTTIPDAWMQHIRWRCIGPANMGGRITSIAVWDKDPTIWWIATASGGLLKTTNNGVTFEHQFDRQSTVSIGDVQVSAVDANIVWVGTGEANPRNSVSWGDGVYKSVDGGKSWSNKGLKQSFQIGRIAVHPTDPNIVFVGALGRLWGPSEERGLYKSTDGGETWKRVLYVDDKTGVIDVRIDPSNPNNVLAATYERMRDGFDSNDPSKKFGPGAGIFRSTDGGETFARVTQGLPTVNIGRIGLEYYAANPAIVYAVVETEKIAQIPEDSPSLAIRTVDAEVGARVDQVTKDSAAEKAGVQPKDVIVAVGDAVVMTSDQFWKNVRLHKAGDKITLQISREKKPVTIDIELEKAAVEDGQVATSNPFTGTLGGQAANLQDQQGAAGINYGGVYQSTDGGATWTRINTLNPRPMYYSQIRVDPKDNQNIYILGTSMHRSKDGGKEFTDGGDRGVHPDHHALWIDPCDPRHMILGNDGGVYVTYDRMENWDHLNHTAIGQFYHVDVDNRRDYWIYGGLQDNGSWGGPARVSAGAGPVNSDWINVGGGDGFVCAVDPMDPNVLYTESQNGSMARINLATGEQTGIVPRPQQDVKFRFNWKTPFALSPQNTRIFYAIGNYVFRSVAEGNALVSISPEITNTSQGSGSAIALSPLEFGVIYAGTTDGAVWSSRDDGKTWTAIFSRPQPNEEPTKAESDALPGPRPDSVRGVVGTWHGKFKDNSLDEERRNFELNLRVDESDLITGTFSAAGNSLEIQTGTYDPSNGSLVLSGSKDQTKFSVTAEICDAVTMTGSASRGEADHAEFDAHRTPAPTPSDSQEPAVGFWELTLGRLDQPAAQRKATLKLEVGADQRLTGTVEIDGRTITIDESKFDPSSKKIVLNFGDVDHDYELAGSIIKRRLNASLDLDFGREVLPVAGWRIPVDTARTPIEPATLAAEWKGVLESESIPEPANRLAITLKTDSAKGFVGNMVAAGQSFSIDSGTFLPETGELQLALHNDNASVQTTAHVHGDVIVGTFTVTGGAMKFDFSVERIPPEPKTPEGAPQIDKPSPPSVPDPARKSETPAVTSDPPAEAKKASESAESPAQEAAIPRQEAEPVDPIAGRWSGAFVGERFRGDRGRFEMKLGRDAAGKVTGNMVTPRGETKFHAGSFDASNGKLELAGANENSTVEMSAIVAAGRMKGTARMRGGRFTADFEAAHENAPSADSNIPPGQPLASLLPGPRWVSSLTASRFDPKRCYITLDGHRSDDDTPYLFASEDYGATWRSVRGNIPVDAGTVHVLREDTDSENVLYVGCEFSAWVSIDRGQSWTKLSGLPTVAVHEWALHPLTHEIVAATHGRSLWIADVDILKQLNAPSMGSASFLFRPNTVVRWRRTLARGSSGTRRFVGENPSNSANIYYLIGAEVGQVELVIRDIEGTKLKTIGGTSERGLQMASWDFSTDVSRDPRRGRTRGRLPSGQYLVELQVDGAILQRNTLTILDDPRFPADSQDAEVGALEEFESEPLPK